MTSSVRIQAAAVARTEAEPGIAYARALAAWSDPYAYAAEPGFTDNRVEQAAQITGGAYVGGGLATSGAPPRNAQGRGRRDRSDVFSFAARGRQSPPRLG